MHICVINVALVRMTWIEWVLGGGGFPTMLGQARQHVRSGNEATTLLLTP